MLSHNRAQHLAESLVNDSTEGIGHILVLTKMISRNQGEVITYQDVVINELELKNFTKLI